MRLSVAIILSLLCSSLLLWSQSSTAGIEGMVINSQNGRVIPRANVLMRSGASSGPLARYPIKFVMNSNAWAVRCSKPSPISEVLHVAEQHTTAQIVISHDLQPEAAKVIQRYYTNLHVQRNASTADVLFELMNLTKGPAIK